MVCSAARPGLATKPPSFPPAAASTASHSRACPAGLVIYEPLVDILSQYPALVTWGLQSKMSTPVLMVPLSELWKF